MPEEKVTIRKPSQETIWTEGAGAVDGQRIKIKFIASKVEGQAYFWGANLEVGRVAHRLDENPWNAELKGTVCRICAPRPLPSWALSVD